MSAPARETQSRGGDPVRPAATGRGPAAPEAHALAELQQVLGNLGVIQRLPDPAIQARLEVGAPDDAYEREADAIAASIMGGADSAVGATGSGERTLRRRAEDDDKKKPPPRPPAPQRAAGAAAKAPQASKPAATVVKAPAAAPKAPTPTVAATPATKPPIPAVAKAPKAPSKPKLPERKRDELLVRTKATPGAVPAVTPAAARTIQSQQGGGQPLPAADRGFFESRLGRDLGAVRLHDDGPARAAARDVQAQAFTYGQDVYFGAGRYQPGTAGGRELLAHELAHTIQQRPRAPIERRVQRATAKPGTPAATKTAPATPAATPKVTTPQTGTGADPATPPPIATRTDDTITFRELPVPKFRLEGAKGSQYNGYMMRPKGYGAEARKGVNQRDVWKEDKAIEASVGGHVTKLLKDKMASPVSGRHLVKSVAAGDRPHYHLGTTTDLISDLSIPYWGRSSAEHKYGFDVDHIMELQLAGNYPEATTIANLELLDASVNRSSGALIAGAIAGRVNGYLRSLPQSERHDPKLDFDHWRTEWNVAFEKGVPRTAKSGDFAPEGGVAVDTTRAASATDADHWTKDEIVGLKHFKCAVVAPASWREIGGVGRIFIFPRAAGGRPTVLETKGEVDSRFVSPFTIVDRTIYDTTDDPNVPVAKLTLKLDLRAGIAGPIESHDIDVPRLRDAQFAGYMSKRSAKKLFVDARPTVPGMSTVEIDDVDMGPNGFQAEGRIIATVPFLENVPIDLSVDGDDISVSKTFSVDDFKKVPKPLHIDRTNLRVGVSQRDLSLDGRLDLSIDRLGTGFLEGKGSISKGFALAGGFTANTDIFRSHVDLAYVNDQASGRGTLDIDKPGKVPGVSKAHFDVVYENERLSATGAADFDIPGKPHADVHLEYDPVLGLSFGGTVKIGKLSGLKGAEATVAVTERQEGGGYVVRARGTATPDIKGVTGEATLDYDDGAFLALVKVHVTKGKLDGMLEAGATNRPLDELGRPVLGPVTPLPEIEKFGAGTARLDLNKWLQGGAGFRLLPSGDVIVSGTLLVVGAKLWEGSRGDPISIAKSPEVKINIFGPLDLVLSAGAEWYKGFGPGLLFGQVHVEYSPTDESQTKVAGELNLLASAAAGIDVYIAAGLELDAWFAGVKGEVKLGAGLEAEVAAAPAIAIDWTPQKGLTFDAEVKGSVAPQFEFFASADVVAHAGPFHKTWELGRISRKFGHGVGMSLTAPLHYDETGGFEFDWQRFDVAMPEIHPIEIAENIVHEVVP